VWEGTLNITGIISKVISMAEKINPDDENIIIVLTSEEYETLRKGCMDLLDYYELSRSRAIKVRNILDKLEGAGK